MNGARYWKPNEVARHFRLNVETIYRRIKAGDIHAVRIGGQYRIPEDEVLSAGRRVAIGAHGRQQSTTVDNRR